MTRLTAVLALVATAWLVPAAAAGDTPSWSAPGCDVGLSGDNAAGSDHDADGVPDSEDFCANSPKNTRVNPRGCALGQVAEDCGTAMAPMEAAPAVVPVVAPVREAPADPSPAPVKPADTDEDDDGVDDEDDRCLGTPKGAEVDRHGCVKIEKVVLKGVNFATGSATLKAQGHDTLRSVASAMKADEDLEVEIGGHTDSVGPEDKNQKLSERRADAVKEFLVKEGIDDDRLSTKGFGESQPADTNDTAAGRANNRRVAFRITDD